MGGKENLICIWTYFLHIREQPSSIRTVPSALGLSAQSRADHQNPAIDPPRLADLLLVGCLYHRLGISPYPEGSLIISEKKYFIISTCCRQKKDVS
jgi:hypothetical protein